MNDTFGFHFFDHILENIFFQYRFFLQRDTELKNDKIINPEEGGWSW